MRSRTAGAIVTMSHPAGHGGPATSPNGMRVRTPQIEQLVTDRIRQLFGEPASLIEAAERFRLEATLPLHTALVIPTRVRACARVGGQKTPVSPVAPGAVPRWSQSCAPTAGFP